MRKEFKIGMLIALPVVIIAIVWLSTHKKATVESRAIEQSQEQMVPFVPTEANTLAAISAVAESNTPASLPPLIEDGNTTADFSAFEKQEPIKTERFHIVHKGDMLSTISQKYYGTTKGVQKIFDANRDILKSKDMLRPGMKLRIPD